MTALFKSRASADAMAEKLRVYAQPQRLMVLSYLLEGERTVSQIDATTAIGQPALSQQLAELRRNELVRTRREAKQVFYSLADDTIALCVRTMEAMMSGNKDPSAALHNALNAPSANQASARVPHGAAGFARIG